MLRFSKKTNKNKAQALKIIEEAYAEAKTVKKEALQEAKEEVQNLRLEFEKEQKEKKLEVQKTEDRILQREEFIDKKELALDKKAEAIEQSKIELQSKNEELQKAIEEQNAIKLNMIKELEKVSGMKREEAKQILITNLTDDAKSFEKDILLDGTETAVKCFLVDGSNILEVVTKTEGAVAK